MFLAILGHDLRTPLSAVFTSSRFMLDTNELPEPHLTLTSRIASSSTRMIGLVGDLLDFTRSRLGGGIPVEREEMSMGKALHEVVEEVLAAHPGAVVNMETRNEQQGEWDPARISQALGNLIGNALEHGFEDSEVTVVLSGDEQGICISVHNVGPAIPAERLDGIFNPMKTRDANAASRGPSSNLGLGLYIAERIVQAHDGPRCQRREPRDLLISRIAPPGAHVGTGTRRPRSAVRRWEGREFRGEQRCIDPPRGRGGAGLRLLEHVHHLQVEHTGQPHEFISERADDAARRGVDQGHATPNLPTPSSATSVRPSLRRPSLLHAARPSTTSASTPIPASTSTRRPQTT
jgi:hypothetical protein